jgi:DNA-binding CsgD family transcriptional regulator
VAVERANALLPRLTDWHRQTERSVRLGGRRRPPSQELSDAERRILRLLASDLSLPETGRELYLSTTR